jgi:hypothetical protein
VGVAQLAEHRTVAPAVVGSIPITHPIKSITYKLRQSIGNPRIKETHSYDFAMHLAHIGGDMELGQLDYQRPALLEQAIKRCERAQQAGFVTRFENLGQDREETIVGAHTLSPSYIDPTRRLRRSLSANGSNYPKADLLPVSKSGGTQIPYVRR